MTSCDILDIRCIFVNELFGSVALTLIAIAILYFIVASKMKLGFETTLSLFVPIILGFGLVISGFPILYGFITMLAGIVLAFIFLRLFGNR